MEDVIYIHKELWGGSGLKHGTGAICCGCSKCHCYECRIERQEGGKK